MSFDDNLLDYLYSCVKNIVNDWSNVAIAFSGGVDSTLLSKICMDLKKNVFLITIGFPNSHDIIFSKKIAKLLNDVSCSSTSTVYSFPSDVPMSPKHIIHEICEQDVVDTLEFVKSKVSCRILSHIENCIAFFQISKVVTSHGIGNCFLTANGLDELFCGYDRYRSHFKIDNNDSISEFMNEKLVNEHHLLEEVSTVIDAIGVTSYQPFLDSNFINFSKTIPVELKIKGSDDMLRKHIIRNIALKIGVPSESALKPKKAMQYGSLIHKYVLKRKSTFYE